MIIRQTTDNTTAIKKTLRKDNQQYTEHETSVMEIKICWIN